MEAYDILKKIKSFGYQGYLVGGYVRDKLLNKVSYDIDIATNAHPEELKKIFKLDIKDNYGCISFECGVYNVEITTYRIEMSYKNRKPTEFYYTTDILKDLKRRDFTINAICMDENFNVYDPLNGIQDLDNGLIRVIGDIDEKLKEDPLRILRAVRFSSIYDFDIEENCKSYIKSNCDLVRNLSYARKKEELDKILSSNSLRGLELLEELNLMKPLEIVLKREFIPCNLFGSWAQLEYSSNYPFTKAEKNHIAAVKEILKFGITDITFLEYGLSDILTAGKILKKNEEYIINIYDNLPIRNESDLKISGKEISDISNIDKSKIKEIKKDLIRQVLSGNLPNEKDSLSQYIKKNWK